MNLVNKILHEAVSADLPQIIKSIKIKFKTPKNEIGDCAIVSNELWKMLGGFKSGYKCFSVMLGPEEHVILMNSIGNIIDPTAKQFNLPIITTKDKAPYSNYKAFQKSDYYATEIETNYTLDERGILTKTKSNIPIEILKWASEKYGKNSKK